MNMELRIYTLADDYAGYNSPYWAQHGISFLIEVEDNGIHKRILFDTGSYAEPILFNMKLLGIDPKTIDTIVLSHNHFDHTGGLIGILKHIKKNIPIIAHQNIFKTSFAVEPAFLYAGMPPKVKREAEDLGAIWILTRDPLKLASMITTTGEVTKRRDFEKTSIGLYEIRDGRIIQDPLEDEISLVITTPKGLVVITGCSHPGIISIIETATTLTGIKQVRAVIGGLHLINASKERIERTVQLLAELSLNVYAGHCTGLKAEALIQMKLGEKFEKLHAGKTITLR